MSTTTGWKRIVRQFMQPPKPRPLHDPKLGLKIRMRDYKRVLRHGERAQAPSIYPYYEPKIIHKRTETQGHLRKLKLWPSMKNVKLPVTILAQRQPGPDGEMPGGYMPFIKQHMRIKDVKMTEKAGGIEAKIVSTASKHLSKDGKLLRNALFNQLYRMKRKTGLMDEDYRLPIPQLRDGMKDKELRRLRDMRDKVYALKAGPSAGPAGPALGDGKAPSGTGLLEGKKEKLLGIEGPTA